MNPTKEVTLKHINLVKFSFMKGHYIELSNLYQYVSGLKEDFVKMIIQLLNQRGNEYNSDDNIVMSYKTVYVNGHREYLQEVFVSTEYIQGEELRSFFKDEFLELLH